MIDQTSIHVFFSGIPGSIVKLAVKKQDYTRNGTPNKMRLRTICNRHPRELSYVTLPSTAIYNIPYFGGNVHNFLTLKEQKSLIFTPTGFSIYL